MCLYILLRDVNCVFLLYPFLRKPPDELTSKHYPAPKNYSRGFLSTFLPAFSRRKLELVPHILFYRNKSIWD